MTCAPLPRAATQPKITCADCEALCCRLTVVLQPGDVVAAHLTERTPSGLLVMARDDSGWCVAVDAAHRCSIYATRPSACRRFVTGGPYCRQVRADHADAVREIAVTLEQEPSCRPVLPMKNPPSP